jgi:hypothetical protein
VAEDPAVKYATWLTENAGKRGTPEFDTVAAAYKAARAGPAPAIPEESVTMDWKPYVPSGERKGEIANITPEEAVLGSPGGQFAIRAGEPVVAAAQIVERVLPGKPVLPEYWKRTSEAMRRGGELYGGVAEAAGLTGAVLSPANRAVVGAFGPGLKGSSIATQGAVLGGVGGLTSATESDDEFAMTKALQVLASAGGGALLAGALKLGGTGFEYAWKNWLEPVLGNFSQKVRDGIKGKLYQAAAGEKAPQVAAGLRDPQQVVPGAAPTAGEAAVQAGAPGFAALQESAARINPTAYAARADQQSGAVLDNLRSVGKTPMDLQAAQAAQKETSDTLYALARGDKKQQQWAHIDPSAVGAEAQTVVPRVGPTIGYINKLIKENPGNPDLLRALATARKGLVDEQGRARTDPAQIISVLDGIKLELEKSHAPFAQSALREVKDKISEQVPRWKIAETMHGQAGQKISQMELGQDLERTAMGPTGWRAGSGQPLMEDAVLKKINAPEFGLRSPSLDPEALQKIRQVEEWFKRKEALTQQGKLGRPVEPDIHVGTNLPNVLKREVMVMNAILKRLEGKVSSKVAAEVAAEMLNPPVVGDSLQKAIRRAQMNQARAQTMEKLYRQGMPGFVQQVNAAAEAP